MSRHQEKSRMFSAPRFAVFWLDIAAVALFSLIQFFSKMRKWADMSNLSQDFRLRMDRLERNFEVSTVIFRKFEPIFRDMFVNPQGCEAPRQPRSRKHRYRGDAVGFNVETCACKECVCSGSLTGSVCYFTPAGGCPVTSLTCSSSAGRCSSTLKVSGNDPPVSAASL